MNARGIPAHGYELRDPCDPNTPLRPVRAVDPRGGHDVSLLFFPAGLGARYAPVRRELREHGERLLENPHPLFVNVLEAREEEDRLFFVEERPRGETLLSAIRERRVSRAPFTVAEALGVCRLLCRAVEAIRPFSGHGFLNPQEVFLEPWEGGPLPWYPKVARPGVRALLRFRPEAFEGLEEEASLYAAPEFAGRDPLTDAADCYGIAALLYSMLTLAPPTGCFRRPAEFHPGFPEPLERAILRAVEESPGARGFSARGFSRTLEETAGGRVPWAGIDAGERGLHPWRRPARSGSEVLAAELPGHGAEEPVETVTRPGRAARSLFPAWVLVFSSLVLVVFGFLELGRARPSGDARLEEFRAWEARFLDGPAGAGQAGEESGR